MSEQDLERSERGDEAPHDDRVAICSCRTFTVRLYGQNFHHVPELGWAWGYWWAWALIIGTTIIQFAFFRWKRRL